MSKEFKNIDELFKSTIGLGTAKAPANVKASVLSKTGGNSWWLIGASLLLVTAVVAVSTTLNMNTDNTVANYKSRSIALKPDLQSESYSNIIQNDDNIIVGNLQDSEIQSTNSVIAKASPDLLVNPNTEKKKGETKKIDISVPSQKQLPQIKQEESSKLLMNKTSKVIEKEKSALVELKKDDIPNTDPQAIIATENTVLSPQEIDIADENTSQTLPNEPQIDAPTEKADSEFSVKDSGPILTEATDTISKSELVELIGENAIDSSSANIPDSNLTILDSAALDIKIEELPHNKKGYWMIGANIAPNINSAKYGDTEFGQSLDKFHDEKLGFQSQLYGQYISASNFVTSFGLGVENQSYNTTFLTTSVNQQVETTSVFSNYVYDSLNTIIDTVFIDQYDTTFTTKLNNQYGIAKNQYLQIPINFGYQIEKNKWIFGADVGVQLNYLLRGNGTYYLNNEVINQKDMPVVKRTTLNYSIGGNIKYNMLNNIYLTGQVRISPAIQNYYKKSYGTRSVNTVSLGFGIGLKL